MSCLYPEWSFLDISERLSQISEEGLTKERWVNESMVKALVLNISIDGIQAEGRESFVAKYRNEEWS